MLNVIELDFPAMREKQVFQFYNALKREKYTLLWKNSETI
jgi:hypothetical protein